MSGHDLFSSRESLQGAGNGARFLRHFSEILRALDGWIFTRALSSSPDKASIATDLGTVFPYFCMMTRP